VLLTMVSLHGIQAVAVSSFPQMRREQVVTEHEVQLQATGELIDLTRSVEGSSSSGTLDYCFYDFTVATNVSDECVPHSTKLDLADCIEAAKLAGLSDQVVKEINGDDDYEWVRPKGCFAMECTVGSTETCYSFNFVEPGPTNVSGGRPVCKRHRAVYGEILNKITQCPDGYAPVRNEALCLTLGHCMGDNRATQDRVSNYDASQYDHYPMYCFVDESNDKVYYSAPLDTTATPPTDPVGKPICNVTSTTTADADGGS